MTKTIAEMIGQTFSHIVGAEENSDMIVFYTVDFRMEFFHEQDCCENVRILEIHGDISDLLNSPILVAEERVNPIESDDWPAANNDWIESCTATFYEFATIKGSVTIRWLGESNGYYSESVSYQKIALKS